MNLIEFKWIVIMVISVTLAGVIGTGIESYNKSQMKIACYSTQTKSILDLKCGDIK